ncbi:MAG TPA: serine protease [Solirubrobacterales bacterium]|nr:serine protease [Solirubrobacterales bacterium]
MILRKALVAGGVALVAVLVLAVSSAGAIELEREHLGGPGNSRASSERPQTRIVGGGPADNSQFPWQVQLRVNLAGGETFLCGGSLIHPLIVLSAAHCFLDEFGDLEPIESVEVWIGRTLFDSGGELDFGVEVWGPENYDPVGNFPRSNSFDFAFLTLDSATAQPRIQIAGPTETALWTPGRVATVTGWGAIFEDGPVSPVLKQAQIPFLADQSCAGAYGAAYDPQTMVCAGELAGGTDSCQGDSGGPLMSPTDASGLRLTGIVSWGEGCARPGRPGVYTRIAGPLVGGIQSAVDLIEEEEGFPSQLTGIEVVGSGARPPGCAAAEAALAGAGPPVTAANALVTQRSSEAQRAAKGLRSAKKSVKKARRSGKRVRPATRRLFKAKRRLKVANLNLTDARSQATWASEALTAATANRAKICG